MKYIVVSSVELAFWNNHTFTDILESDNEDNIVYALHNKWQNAWQNLPLHTFNILYVLDITKLSYMQQRYLYCAVKILSVYSARDLVKLYQYEDFNYSELCVSAWELSFNAPNNIAFNEKDLQIMKKYRLQMNIIFDNKVDMHYYFRYQKWEY